MGRFKAAHAMSELESLGAGREHDLRFGIMPSAPEDSHLPDVADGAFGYVHSYETASRCDGPGLRFVPFVSGCPLRCSYCHNPDSWHLKNGAPIPAGQVIHRLAGFASALRALDGCKTASSLNADRLGKPLIPPVLWGLHYGADLQGNLVELINHRCDYNNSSAVLANA